MARSVVNGAKLLRRDPIEEEGEQAMIKEFREFIERGNVIDLAVAFVLGVAFTGVVNAFADGVLMQIIAALFNQPDFSNLTIDLRDTPIYYGAFITQVINFLIVAFAMFLVVKGINAMQNLRRASTADVAENQESEIELLAQIRDSLAQRN
jgi:large conductance mechanosensitive channel